MFPKSNSIKGSQVNSGILYWFTSKIKVFFQIIRNLGTALLSIAAGVNVLVAGIFDASRMILKGIALSISALFFETGLSNVVAGISKNIFIFEESLAAATDRLIDGCYGFGKFLRAAFSNVFPTKVRPSDNLKEDYQSSTETICLG